MLEKYAQQKLKGLSLDRRFRKRLMPLNDPGTAEPLSDETSPHEVGFHAKLADSVPVELTLEGAEVLGPKRYRLATRIKVPVESAGGFYKFDGNIPVIRRPIGWIVEKINVDIEVFAILDVAWKSLPTGNIGIYPGGFLDESLTPSSRPKPPSSRTFRSTSSEWISPSSTWTESMASQWFAKERASAGVASFDCCSAKDSANRSNR